MVYGNVAVQGSPSLTAHGLSIRSARRRIGLPSTTTVSAGRMNRRPRTPDHRPSSWQQSPKTSNRDTSKPTRPSCTTDPGDSIEHKTLDVKTDLPRPARHVARPEQRSAV